MERARIAAGILAVFISISAVAADQDDIASRLAVFTEAYETDRMATRERTFGIEITDAEPARWHVIVAPRESGGADVQLVEGFPERPIFYFTLDLETLEKIENGTWAGMTAMVREFSSDSTPMDVAFTEGYEPGDDFMASLLSITFHFWNPREPEIVNFGKLEHTRHTHGAQASVFYYQEGLRLGYLMLKPGQHANEKPESQTNPFPTFLIVTEGKMNARIGDTAIVLQEGQGVFIGPQVHPEFTNEFEDICGAVLVMFGEGA